jgi:hypothetical protein
MTGTGPEKSFPVILANVWMSAGVSAILREKWDRIRAPYGTRFLRQWSILAGSLLSSALNLFLQAFLSLPGRMYEISS